MNVQAILAASAAVAVSGCYYPYYEERQSQEAKTIAMLKADADHQRRQRQDMELRYKTERIKAEVAQRTPAVDVDKSARTMQTCDSLFPMRGDAHRLCMLRGMDRYVDHMTPPRSERYLQHSDEISVLVPVPQLVPVPRAEAVPPHVHPTPPQVSGSALVDCRINPTPPCVIPPYIAPDHGGLARPPHAP